MNDHETPSLERIKSPLLYQLSYRDERHTSIAEPAPSAPIESAEVGGAVGVLVLAQRLLNYNPDTGALTWKVSRRKCRPGAPAGSITHEGYVRVDMTGCTLAGHRLAWMLQTGAMPPARIDHINGDRADNRWCNLRAATAVQNATNSEQVARATGVWRRYGKVYARLRHDGRVHSSGPFATEAEATAWYVATSERLRGEWAPLVHRSATPARAQEAA